LKASLQVGQGEDAKVCHGCLQKSLVTSVPSAFCKLETVAPNIGGEVFITIAATLSSRTPANLPRGPNAATRAQQGLNID